MSRGFNKVILMGNLARDPDVRYTPNKQKVAKFSIAVGRQWKDKETGEQKSQTDFIPIVAWAFLADLAENYMRKGKPVLVEGRMQVREYSDPKTGDRKWATEVVAENLTMLPGGKQDEGQPPREAQGGRGGHDRQGGSSRTVESDDDFPLDFASLGGEPGGYADVPF